MQGMAPHFIKENKENYSLSRLNQALPLQSTKSNTRNTTGARNLADFVGDVLTPFNEVYLKINQNEINLTEANSQ